MVYTLLASVPGIDRYVMDQTSRRNSRLFDLRRDEQLAEAAVEESDTGLKTDMLEFVQNYFQSAALFNHSKYIHQRPGGF